jgi:hypothetical protein
MYKPLKMDFSFLSLLLKKELKIININSKVQADLNLCKLVNYGNFESRTNLTDPDKIIQSSLIKMIKFQSVPKHEHLPIERHTKGTGEGWLILQGSFEVEIFDVDRVSVGKYFLKKFDMLIMFNGGHSLRATKRNSIMFEFKNGPFRGSDSDKIYF